MISKRVLICRRSGPAALLVVAAVLSLPLLIAAAAAKDTGPIDQRCDGFAKAGPEWTRCVENHATSDSELFYAGYWLAKSGAYREALAQLERVANPNPRVLTYIGFSWRKLDDYDRALTYYGRALAADPDFSVARAYLGEAYLALDDPARAHVELGEIRSRCGPGCIEYAELAGHIQSYKARSKL